MSGASDSLATFRPENMDAVIFGMDGVLTDTASVHAAAWKRMFDEYMKGRAERRTEPFRPFDIDSDYRSYVDGKPRYDGVESFLESRSIPLPRGDPDDSQDVVTVCGLGNRKNGYYLGHLRTHGVEPYHSSVKFVEELRAARFKTAVISASRNCAQVLEAAGLRDLFDVRVDGVDLAGLGLKGKPDPAIFLEVARRLGVSPQRAVVVEDAIAGVEAGRRGGFWLVVRVDRTGHPEELIENGAHLVVQDLDELSVGSAGTAPRKGTRRAIRDLPSALHEERRIVERLKGWAPSVFLDYDGTLTPIVGDPTQALLPNETREVIDRLPTVCTVAIISGRDLADVQAMVGIGGLVYAGSHGFDIVGPGRSLRDQERGRPFLPALDRAEEALLETIENVPGARVERKLFAIAVHYRSVRDDDVPSLEGAVYRVVAQEPMLRNSGGKKVFELRPNIAWDRGRALLHLLDVLGLDREKTVPLFIGDDVTDEDAFSAIRDFGIGIVVGSDNRLTEAKYALQDPAEVRVFLQRFIDSAGKGSR